jgi:hypothetical protein
VAHLEPERRTLEDAMLRATSPGTDRFDPAEPA